MRYQSSSKCSVTWNTCKLRCYHHLQECTRKRSCALVFHVICRWWLCWSFLTMVTWKDSSSAWSQSMLRLYWTCVLIKQIISLPTLHSYLHLSQTQGLWRKPSVLCHWAQHPMTTTSPSVPFWLSSEWLCRLILSIIFPILWLRSWSLSIINHRFTLKSMRLGCISSRSCRTH